MARCGGAGDPDDLANGDLEVDPVQHGRCERARAQGIAAARASPPRRALALLDHLELSAEHELRERALAESGRGTVAGDDGAVLEHGHAVPELENLVEPVADDDHGGTGRGEPADGLVEVGQDLAREGTRRLVEDDRAGAGGDALQRAADRHDGLLARAQRVHQAVAVDIGVQPLERAARGNALAPPVDPATEPAHRELPQADVLEHRLLADEAQILMHEREAVPTQLRRPDRVRERRSADLDDAVVGGVHAREDLDQGRLARAVLPDEAVDLTRTRVEVDLAQHRGGTERLGQAADADPRRRLRLRRGTHVRPRGRAPAGAIDFRTASVSTRVPADISSSPVGGSSGPRRRHRRPRQTLA